jgi:hypothetical protein
VDFRVISKISLIRRKVTYFGEKPYQMRAARAFTTSPRQTSGSSTDEPYPEAGKLLYSFKGRNKFVQIGSVFWFICPFYFRPCLLYLVFTNKFVPIFQFFFSKPIKSKGRACAETSQGREALNDTRTTFLTFRAIDFFSASSNAQVQKSYTVGGPLAPSWVVPRQTSSVIGVTRFHT